MRTLFTFAVRSVWILCFISPAIGQDNGPANANRSGLTVTASASSDHVRFTAPSSVVQIRLEVYNTRGKKVFDNEVRGGNLLDWHLQDGQADRLSDDTYLCVVTVKSLSGKLTQRIASLTIEKASARLQALDVSQITTQQTEAIGPMEANASLTVLQVDEQRTATVVAHDGEDGQITRGRGALSFRLGDFFTGKDKEQMRLTAEGNLGIGVGNPQSKLDVDGLIRASDSKRSAARLVLKAAAASRNAVQSRDGGGMVKAMAVIEDFVSQPVLRCYNSQLSGSAASTPPCGLTFSKQGAGHYLIDFGFEVDDRFVLVSPIFAGFANVVEIDPLSVTANQIRVRVKDLDSADLDRPFYIFIF